MLNLHILVAHTHDNCARVVDGMRYYCAIKIVRDVVDLSALFEQHGPREPVRKLSLQGFDIVGLHV
jgi:hypothetical protein